MTTLKEDRANVLISPDRYSLEELDNYLNTWKTSGEFDDLISAEAEMIKRVNFNPELKFRIVLIKTNEQEVVMTSEDIPEADTLDDDIGNQAI